MATTAAILDALAQQLRDQINPSDISLSIEGRAFAAATVPAIDMYWTGPGAIQNIEGFGELQGGISINIRVRVSTADLYSGEDLLLALIDDEDPLSIVTAINYDTTLGGLTSDVVWGEWSGYTDFPVGGSENDFYLGSILPCLLVKARS